MNEAELERMSLAVKSNYERSRTGAYVIGSEVGTMNEAELGAYVIGSEVEL